MRLSAAIATTLLVLAIQTHYFCVGAVKDGPSTNNNNNNDNDDYNISNNKDTPGEANSSGPPRNQTFPAQGYPYHGSRRRPGGEVGCKELRSKRYISDGFCTSIKPITEVVCAGHCLPKGNLPWYAEFIKVWAQHKTLEHRCVDDVTKRRRVRLLCENGETRTYKIKTVKSCTCKQYYREQNTSFTSALTLEDAYRSERRRRNQRRERRRKERRRKKEKNSSTPDITNNNGEL